MKKSYSALELNQPRSALLPARREVGPMAEGQVRVRLHAAGLNRRDLWIWLGKYADMRFPMVLGSDGCGVVEDVGPGVSASMLGKRVVVNPSLDWGDGQRAPGPEWRILGMPDEGTLAECVTVKSGQVHEAPSHLQDTEAAALPLAGLTGWRALVYRGELRAGQRVLLTGIGGGVAQWMLAFARALGAEVWATSGSEEKLRRAVKAGARGGVSYASRAWQRELSEQVPEGFDLVVDSAGGEGFPSLLDLVKPGGKVVFFGATQGNVPELSPRKMFWKHLDLRGTTMGSPSDFKSMLALVAEHEIRPVIDRILPWSQASKAFARLESCDQYGKIVLTPE